MTCAMGCHLWAMLYGRASTSESWRPFGYPMKLTVCAEDVMTPSTAEKCFQFNLGGTMTETAANPMFFPAVSSAGHGVRSRSDGGLLLYSIWHAGACRLPSHVRSRILRRSKKPRSKTVGGWACLADRRRRSNRINDHRRITLVLFRTRHPPLPSLQTIINASRPKKH